MTDYELLLSLLRDEGMDFKWAKMFVKKLSDDESAFPTDDHVKEWALSRGFYPGRVELYGLNEQNYTDFLPDYQYFMLHPLNHHFKIWVNDKLTLKYILDGEDTRDTMPRYYLYVENNGDYTYLMDAPDYIKRDSDFIFNLLKDKGTLAAKPNSGTSGGRGFMKLEYRSGEIYCNNAPMSKADFDAAVSDFKNTIVTEYAYQHEDLSKIWPDSECTLRVVMAKLPHTDRYSDPEWECIISYARFGTSRSGGASNLSSGGIGIGFDFENGRFKDYGIRYKRFCPDGEWMCFEHPDTHVVWKSAALPNWNIVREKIDRVCKRISSLDYLGLDIIITPTGLKFCEINTHPAADYEQILCKPILSNPRARSFFEGKGMSQIDSGRFLELYKRSQKG